MSTNYEIKERLKAYKEFQVEMCDECGYEGTFGITKAKVPGLLRGVISLALLVGVSLLWEFVFKSNPLAWFFLFPPVGGFYLFYMIRKDVVCPNCLAKRGMSESKIALYDANKYDITQYGPAAEANTKRILAYMEQYDEDKKREKIE